MCEQLGEIRKAMAAYSATFEAALFSVADAHILLRDATAIEHMAATVKAMAAARICSGDQRPGAQRLAAEQLAELTGTTLGAANDTIAVGRRLQEQPEVAAAARAGALSAPQLLAVTDGAAANPDAEGRLLDKAATASLAELRDESARVKAAAQPDPDRRRAEIRAARRFRSWTDLGGVGHVAASGNVEDIAQVAAAVRVLADDIFHAARARGDREPSQAYEFDALVQMAMVTTSASRESDPSSAPEIPRQGTPLPPAATDDDRCAPNGVGIPTGDSEPRTGETGTAGAGRMGGSVGTGGGIGPDGPTSGRGPAPRSGRGATGGAGPGTGGGPGSAMSTGSAAPSGTPDDGGPPMAGISGAPPDADGKRRRGRRGAQVKLLLRVDLDAFLRGYPLDGELCELDGCGPVPMAAVHDLLEKGDPLVAAILTRGKTVFGVAHLRRQATAHQKTALEWLYPSCNVKGCNCRAYLEIDHRIDWAKGHYTALEILDCLCRFHHARKTREGWALVDGAGKRAFVPPDDARHPRHNPDRGSGR